MRFGIGILPRCDRPEAARRRRAAAVSDWPGEHGLYAGDESVPDEVAQQLA